MRKTQVTTKEVDQAVEKLQQAYAHGLLSEQELDEKMHKAITAKKIEELEELLVESFEEEVREDKLSAIVGGLEKNGHFVVGKSLSIKAILGGCSIDFRKAVFLHQETIIYATAILGGIDMIVPADARIILEGSPIIGGISQESPKKLPDDAPRIRIKAKAIMAGIDIRTKDY